MTRHIDPKTLYAYLDGQLSPSKKAAAERHMRDCAACRNAVSRMKRLRKSAVSASEIPEPDWREMDRKMTVAITGLTSEQHRAPGRRLFSASAVFVMFAATGVLALTALERTAPKRRVVDQRSARQTGPAPPLSRPFVKKTVDMAIDYMKSAAEAPNLSPPEETLNFTTDGQSTALAVSRIVNGGDLSIRNGEPTERSARKWPGRLPVKLIREILDRKKLGIQKCFERALKRNTKLVLYLDIELVVDNSGNVKRVSQKGDGVPPEMERCVEQHLKRTRFPAPKGGPMKVVMPLRLYPKP